jgi:nucleotide-binding universal stress UspA family protein
VPGVPLVPALGVLANLALIYNLPFKGIVTGVALVIAVLGGYLAWGGAPDVDELFERTIAAGGAAPEEPSSEPPPTVDQDRYRILVPIARPSRAPLYVGLAGAIGSLQAENPIVQVVTITQIPDQTPFETVEDTTRGRVTRIEELLAREEIEVEYTVEGHTCKDVAFDIVQSAREAAADLILMGYPEEHTDVAQRVDYRSPCGVIFANGFADATDVGVVTVGAGGGPHHLDLLPIVDRMGQAGSEINVVNVDPSGGGGVTESIDATMANLAETSSVAVHQITAPTVAEGLVESAAEHGGLLVIGATRTRRLRRWVFGSTPDRVVALAEGAGVPVLVYASRRGIHGPFEDYVYPIYRRLRGRTGRAPAGLPEESGE